MSDSCKTIDERFFFSQNIDIMHVKKYTMHCSGDKRGDMKYYESCITICYSALHVLFSKCSYRIIVFNHNAKRAKFVQIRFCFDCQYVVTCTKKNLMRDAFGSDPGAI